MTEAAHRGQLFGTHCAVCKTEFTDEDRPAFTGLFAPVAATGLTMTCRHCREYAEVKRQNGERPDPSRLWQVLKCEAFAAWHIPNMVRWLSRRFG